MIEVTGLTKRFGPKAAVDDLSFSVKKGEVLGFLGPNGAGKSTTMRMVTGFLPATAGEISICDISMIKNPEEAKRKIGYLPESAPLYNDMSVQGFLKFCASMRGLVGSKRREAVAKIDRDLLSRKCRPSVDRNTLQRIPPPDLSCTIPPSRPRGSRSRRTDRRSRPQPKT
jgi:ABC-type multidrug transport system ATPase subunit